MQKYIRVTMPDGSKYDVPAYVIASNRAKYYENEEEAGTYEAEFNSAMANNNDLLDWAANNMNWEDVEKHAVRISKMKVDFQEGWLNGDKEIVEA